MLAFISPILIKKLILNIFMTNLSVVMNAQAQDSLAPKKEERIPGKIMKMEEHDIKLLHSETISFFTQNETISPKSGLVISGCQACGTNGRLRISSGSSKFDFKTKSTFSTRSFRQLECIKPETHTPATKATKQASIRTKQGETKTVLRIDKNSKG